ncbi:MAG TPA: PrsW family intramembrane metalloprotease [Bacteroidales bacterium]|nr:PrsW family intramembrane metalloprotease [Bacteroidales bacterium]HSA43661.1 PrsW family intramembrane metalloprotease [Bacteroidales bacterium]
MNITTSHLVILITSVVSVVFWLWFIIRYDKYEKEPLRMVLFTMIFGGLVSTTAAGFLNSLAALMTGFRVVDADGQQSPAAAVTFFLFVGFNEEFWKGILTFFLIRKSRHFNEPIDGMIYAMTVGLGFGILENIGYGRMFGLPVFFIRQFNAIPLHIGLSVLWGLGLSRLYFRRNLRLRAFLPYLIVPAILHTIYNLLPQLILNGLVITLLMSAFALLLIWAGTRILKKHQRPS